VALVPVTIARIRLGSGWPLARNMPGGQTLTLANFQEADLIWAGAIILSLILTFFPPETGTCARQARATPAVASP
jgi:hypothetical protein